MVILITGASHTGKTLLAQTLLARMKYPYLSVDHLKMGLIRSGQTALTPYDDAQLTGYLWNILKEIIKTAIENGQNLIVEGCYLPFDWQKSLDAAYLPQIRCFCLVMSEAYISNHFSEIVRYENVIEKRMPDADFCMEFVRQENQYYYQNCAKYGLDCLLIDERYSIEAIAEQIQEKCADRRG